MEEEMKGSGGTSSVMDRKIVTDTENSEAVPRSNTETEQKNLFTKVVNVNNRSYFLDVRENRRGKYLKISESMPGKRKTILLSGHVVGMLVQILDDVIKGAYEKREEVEPTEKWVTIFSRRAQSLQKKIYFDLMENKYGRSLNVAEVSELRPKMAVIISEKGWFHFKRALDEIIQAFPSFQPSEPRERAKPLSSKKLASGPKAFFLDFQESSMGKFLKFAEVKSKKRVTIFLPLEGFSPVIDLLKSIQADTLSMEIPGLVKSNVSVEKDDAEHSMLDMRTLELQAEDSDDNKTFDFHFRKNSHGRFLRITEHRPGKSSAIFVPEQIFLEVQEALEGFLEVE